MLRKILFAVIIITAVTAAVISAHERYLQIPVKLYMVDAEMLRLIPIETRINQTDTQQEAKTVLNELIKRRDENRKIRRLIPNNTSCMSVTVSNDNACVNIKPRYFADIEMNRDIEYLFVYQLVNSLTSIDGINIVSFTIDGREQKKFKGFVDMRDVFVPDYFM